MIVAASVVDEDGVFNRIWYCSDGKVIALVAYTSEEEPHVAELTECDKTVDDLYFGKKDEGERDCPQKDEGSPGLN
jgi:hypothetical protein